jgi:hypothetical protein
MSASACRSASKGAKLDNLERDFPADRLLPLGHEDGPAAPLGSVITMDLTHGKLVARVDFAPRRRSPDMKLSIVGKRGNHRSAG